MSCCRSRTRSASVSYARASRASADPYIAAASSNRSSCLATRRGSRADGIFLTGLLALLSLCQIRLALLANDVDQIAHREVHVDQVQPPARVHLPVRHHVSDDVVGARIGGVAVHGDLEIR